MRNEGIAMKFIRHRLLGGRVHRQAKRDDIGGDVGIPSCFLKKQMPDSMIANIDRGLQDCYNGNSIHLCNFSLRARMNE